MQKFNTAKLSMPTWFYQYSLGGSIICCHLIYQIRSHDLAENFSGSQLLIWANIAAG